MAVGEQNKNAKMTQLWWDMNTKLNYFGDFPGSPVVTHSPSSAVDESSIPGQGAEVPHDLRPENQNRKYKQYCNKFNKDFKNNPHQKY